MPQNVIQVASIIAVASGDTVVAMESTVAARPAKTTVHLIKRQMTS